MKTERIILIGTSRSDHVRNAAIQLGKAGYEVLVVARSGREKELSGLIAHFKGMVTWKNIGLLQTLRKLGPGKVVFVVGDQFEHERVSAALRLWEKTGLLGDAEIYASLSSDPGNLEYWGDAGAPHLPCHRLTRSGNPDLEQWRSLCLPSLAPDPLTGWISAHVDCSVWRTSPLGTERFYRLKIDRKGNRAIDANEPTPADRPVVTLSGGDNTFGVGLSDEETFAWRLQESLPTVTIINRGVEGYDLKRIDISLSKRDPAQYALTILEVSPAMIGDEGVDALKSIIAKFSDKGECLALVSFGSSTEALKSLSDENDIQLLELDTDPSKQPDKVAQAYASFIGNILLLTPEAITEKKLPPCDTLPTSSALMKFHIVNYLWGEAFTRNFLDVILPNHCTDGNLFAFAERTNAIYKVYTRTDDAEMIRRHPLFRKINELIPTEVIALDHLFMDGWREKDNALLLMTSMHRVAVASASRADARLVILPPDQIYSEGAMQRVIEQAEEGKRVVVTQGIRVIRESFAPEFIRRFGTREGSSPVPARVLAQMAFDNMHPIVKAQQIDANPFTTGPAHLLCKLDDTAYVSHNLHMHPLMIHPRKYTPLKEGNFDTSWLAAACPDINDYHIVKDSDEFMTVEISDGSKKIGMEGKGAVDRKKLGDFYRQHATDIHWDFLTHPVLIHSGDIDEKWRDKIDGMSRFIRSVIPIWERIRQRLGRIL